eukprot:12931818-Prorocentrum_lima.AAC.1
MLVGALLGEAAATRDAWFCDRVVSAAEVSYNGGVARAEKIGVFTGTGNAPTAFVPIKGATGFLTGQTRTRGSTWTL